MNARLAKSIMLTVVCAGSAAVAHMAGLRIVASKPDPARGGRLVRQVESACHLKQSATHFVRARVLAWAPPTKKLFAGSPTPQEATAVELEILETLGGSLNGNATVYFGGPFDNNTGRFLDGRVSKNQVVYLSIGSDGKDMFVHSQGYWAVEDKNGTAYVTRDTDSIPETTFRGEVAVCTKESGP